MKDPRPDEERTAGAGEPPEPPVDAALAEWRRAYRDDLPAGSAACPGDDELAALVIGELGRHERLALADHLVSCRRCAAVYGDLVALHAAASAESVESAPAPSPPSPAPHRERDAGRRPGQARPLRLGPLAAAPAARRTPRRWMAWAAAAVLLLVAGVVVRDRLAVAPQASPGSSSHESGPVRGGGEPAVPLLALDPPAGARLTGPPARLSWPAEEPGAIYRVVVYDGESVPLWESGALDQPRVELPAPLRLRLAAGGTFYWRIRVASERGPRTSGLRRFEVGR